MIRNRDETVVEMAYTRKCPSHFEGWQAGRQGMNGIVNGADGFFFLGVESPGQKPHSLRHGVPVQRLTAVAKLTPQGAT